MSLKVRIGILGAANMAIKSILPNILLLKEHFECVGMATRNIEITQTNKNLPAVNWIGSYEELFRKELDAIYIPLPNVMHYEWVKKALQKNIHVLVEKPMTCSYQETLELNELAERKQLVLVENFQFRFHSQLQFVKKLLKNGTLGEIRIFRSTFCCPPFENQTNIRYQPELGGGALLDLGVYPLKISQLLLGKAIEVVTANLNYDKNFGVDTWGGAYLRNTMTGHFSQIAFGFDHFYQNNIEIVGTKGKITAQRFFTARENQQPVFYLETREKGSEKIILKMDNHFQNMLLHFHNLIFYPEKRKQEYDDNINQARLVEEVLKKSYKFKN